jgi:hypothetical protein
MKLITPVLAIAVGLALAGCGTMGLPTGSTPTPSATPTPTASPSATPSPTPTAMTTPAPEASGDVLFTIKAKLTSPTGATATITQTVFAPFDELDDQDAVEDQLDEECAGWRQTIGDDAWLVSKITAKDTSTGSRTWDSGPQFVVMMAGTSVFQGDYSPFQAYCVSAQGHVPGVIRAVSPLDPDIAPDSLGGWASIAYGFGTADDSNRVSGCTITVTPLARTESELAKTWPTLRQNPGFCEINTLGL